MHAEETVAEHSSPKHNRGDFVVIIDAPDGHNEGDLYSVNYVDGCCLNVSKAGPEIIEDPVEKLKVTHTLHKERFQTASEAQISEALKQK